MDGLTCTREIRQMEADGLLTSHLTIVAVTANARAEQLEMAYAAGVVSFQNCFSVAGALLSSAFSDEVKC